ncbi:MAG: hypothetical protein O7B25_11950 [Gammaproteobacteria bacterium]|nr:hypothetical protein [Gammaproteobacteria bacterium]
MKIRKTPLLMLAPVGFMMVALAIPSVATANTTDGQVHRPGVTEEVIANREARRAEIANMSDEERTAAREQRRDSMSDRRASRGDRSDADRQARRDRAGSRRGADGSGQRGAGGTRRGHRRG